MTETNDPGELARLLASLRETWAERGAPNLPHLRPGLSQEAVNVALADSTLPVPPDILTWFGWHDGAHNPDLSEAVQHIFAPGDANRFIGEWYLLTLRQALDERQNALEAEAGLPLDHPLFRPGWLPVLMMHTSASACVDLAGEAGPAGTLYLYDPHGMLPQDPPVMWFSDLSALVSAALDSVRSGAVASDLRITNPDRLPASGTPFLH